MAGYFTGWNMENVNNTRMNEYAVGFIVIKLLFYIYSFYFISTFKDRYVLYKKNGDLGASTFLPGLGIVSSSFVMIYHDIFGDVPIILIVLVFLMYLIILAGYFRI